MARVWITDRDVELLEFLSRHRVVLASQAHALLGGSADAVSARMRALRRAALIDGQRFLDRHPRCYWITRRGLSAIASPLPPPRIDLRFYWHDIGIAWVWLAARRGAFGSLAEVLSERELRSRDGADAHRARVEGAQTEPLAVRLGGVAAGGRERLHYPDLLLMRDTARRVAIELELTPKTRTRRERILAGYAGDSRIDAVLYLVDQAGVARGIRASAARLGLASRTQVQRVRWDGTRVGGGRGRDAARAPTPVPAIGDGR